MRWSRIVLILVLVLESAGGLLVALINLAVSDFIGADVLPPQAALAPAGFAIFCIVGAVGISQRTRWGVVITVIIQVAVLAGGIIGLVYSGDPFLWAAIVIGLLGLVLVWISRQTPVRR
ncbi:MAG TPA: hypothetical protein VM470_07650 [Acidimicrobiia bacterium]|nr:hypothetical protein [Acidimicrobiia bacterium]